MPNSLSRSFIVHLCIVLLLCMLLFVLFFATLRLITAHGEEVKMPDINGKDYPLAIAQIKAMHFAIKVDSAYEPGIKPRIILSQMPDGGAVVKPGRTVYLTVSKYIAPKIRMPNLVGLSFTSAQMLLRNNRLVLGDTVWKPSSWKGSVLEQRMNGTAVWQGKMISQGSKVDIVLGAGMGRGIKDMPDLFGQSLSAALTLLSQYHAEVEIVSRSGGVIDSNSSTVIDQDPKDASEEGVFNHIRYGTKVTLTVD